MYIVAAKKQKLFRKPYSLMKMLPNQKFVVERFYQWQMSNEKEKNIQINEYQKLFEDLKVEGITLPEIFVVG